MSDNAGRISFAGFTLDLGNGRLVHGDRDVTLRAKSFAVLEHLTRHAGRVVTKDELLSAVWPNVTVTEDSLTQCVHEIRQALGPQAARHLRTIPRRGYLFLSRSDPVQPDAPAQPPAEAASGDSSQDLPALQPALRRDGIAVLPFELAGKEAAGVAGLLDGLCHDIISRLARLRCFHVIARGSTFTLRHLIASPVDAGRALGVAYVVTGRARISGATTFLQIELVDCADGTVVWNDEFVEQRDVYGTLLHSVTDRLIHCLQREITSAERNRALLISQPALDTWEAYHRGLFHMLQFSSAELARARSYFDRSVDLDPSYARSHAALSYCHFLEAFLRPTDQRGDSADLALQCSGRAMQLDDQSPASRWAYGRALWLHGHTEDGIQHMRTAIDISPSFAMGHQSLSFFLFQSGDPADAIACADAAESLSPFDPFLCAIHGAKAMALARQGRFDQAADFAIKAAQQPNVHKHILAISAMALTLADRREAALGCMNRVRQIDPAYALVHFREAFTALSDDALALVRQAAPGIGLA